MILANTRFGSIALKTELSKEDGFLSQGEGFFHLVGKEGIAETILRPAGKIQVEGNQYDAVANYGIIEKGTPIKVLKFENSQLVVQKK